MLTTRPPVLPSGINRFSRSWLFGAVAPRIFLFFNNNKETEYTSFGTYLCLFFHIAGFDVKALVVPWHQFVYTLFIPCSCLVIQSVSFMSSSFACLPARCLSFLETGRSLTMPGPDCMEDAQRCPNGIAQAARLVSAGQYGFH